MTSRMTMISEE